MSGGRCHSPPKMLASEGIRRSPAVLSGTLCLAAGRGVPSCNRCRLELCFRQDRRESRADSCLVESWHAPEASVSRRAGSATLLLRCSCRRGIAALPRCFRNSVVWKDSSRSYHSIKGILRNIIYICTQQTITHQDVQLLGVYIYGAYGFQPCSVCVCEMHSQRSTKN